MAKSVTVPESCDTSKELQALIDKTGNTQAVYSFSKDHKIEINSLIKLYNNTSFLGNGAKFHLKDNSPNFGEQVPMIGQKGSSITGLNIENIIYDGNYTKQPATPGDHGKGYGNAFGFSNITNSVFKNVSINKNEGDGWRLTGGSKLTFEGCSGTDGGHDFIHAYKCSDVAIRGCSVEIRANNAVRVRSSSNVLIDSCKFTDVTDNAWSPAVQIENIESGKSCKNIEIKNTTIQSTYGPGIWGIANNPLGTSADIHIHDNIIKQCGMMPASNKISGVGGIVCDGFTNVLIDNNVFDECYGNAVSFVHYQGSGNVKGCKATVKNNTISNTKKSLYPGVASGYAIANVLGKDYYIVNSSDNVFLNNVSGDHYGAINISTPQTSKYYIKILCDSQTDAQALQEDLQAHIGARSIQILKEA